MRNFPIVRLAFLSFLIAIASCASSVAAPGSALQKIMRGKTECKTESGDVCGTEYWTLYVHSDGSRTMHVASASVRSGEIRHAILVVDADGAPSEAFMHNRAPAGALGSAYMVKTPEGVEQAIHDDEALNPDAETLVLQDLEVDGVLHSLSAGPLAADGLHFLNYDYEKGGEQARNVFWVGGSRHGSMGGRVRPTSHTYLGEQAIEMPQGYAITTDHFRMSSGSEIWITKDNRVVVQADVRFGSAPPIRYNLVELDVTVIDAE